jgi:hypothetical protein
MKELFKEPPAVGKTVEFTDRTGIVRTGVVEFSSISYIGVSVTDENGVITKHQVNAKMSVSVKEAANG